MCVETEVDGMSLFCITHTQSWPIDPLLYLRAPLPSNEHSLRVHSVPALTAVKMRTSLLIEMSPTGCQMGSTSHIKMLLFIKSMLAFLTKNMFVNDSPKYFIHFCVFVLAMGTLLPMISYIEG